MPHVRKLTTLLRNIFHENLPYICEVYYDSAKIIYFKQKRIAHRLKRVDFSRAISLMQYHYMNNKTASCVGQLGALLGQCSEGDALKYYDQIICGNITDRNGDIITIEKNGFDFLYKDPTQNKHTVDPNFYVETRGKRLPWITHTVQKSKEIYRKDERLWTTYMYVHTFEIPISGQPSVKNFFVVITRKETGKNLRFITAYPIFKKNNFLSTLEEFYPYRAQN